MANGDIVFARIPIDIDPDGLADAALVTAFTTLFPSTEFDIINTQIVPDLGKGGAKQVLVVVARDTT